MRTHKLPVAATLCAVIGAFSIPAGASAKTASKHPAAASPNKAGMEFSASDGVPGHFRLTCHDVSAYDALVAIAKRRGYVLTFDPAGEAACRRANLNGVYSQPWMGLEGANIEPIIVESVAQDADLPSNRLLRYIRKNKKSPAHIAIVDRSSLDSSGQLTNSVAKKN